MHTLRISSTEGQYTQWQETQPRVMAGDSLATVGTQGRHKETHHGHKGGIAALAREQEASSKQALHDRYTAVAEGMIDGGEK